MLGGGNRSSVVACCNSVTETAEGIVVNVSVDCCGNSKTEGFA